MSLQERKQMWWVFVAVLAMAVMEVVGVASIMPFIAVIARPELINESRVLHWLYISFGFASENSFLVFLGVFVLFALVTSNALGAVTLWVLVRFGCERNYTFARRLLVNYIYMPYSFYLNRNSSELGKNILSEVGNVVSGLLVPGIQTFAKGIIVIFLEIFLLIINPLLTLAMTVILGGCYFLTYVLVQRKMSLIGEANVISNEKQYLTVAEIFGGIREIKIFGREKHAITKFSNYSQQYARYQASGQVISQLPRFVMESIVFGAVVLVVLYYLVMNERLTGALPIIAAFTLAGYRMMPALQQIFRTITSLDYYRASVDILYREMKLFPDGECAEKRRMLLSDDVKWSLDRCLEIRGVSFCYPGTQEQALTDITFAIQKNTTVGLVGATGSGKTTLVDIILGLLVPQKGMLCLDDVPIDPMRQRSWQRLVGYVPQQIFLSDDTIAHNIAFGLLDAEIDGKAVEQAARIANIHDFVMGLPQGYATIVGERGIRLSGGERQRIGIARALYNDPEVLVMDEATSALDGITENAIISALDNLSHKKTMIIVAHRLTTVQHSDVIYFLEAGKILESGAYHELIARNTKFELMTKMNQLSRTKEAING